MTRAITEPIVGGKYTVYTRGIARAHVVVDELMPFDVDPLVRCKVIQPVLEHSAGVFRIWPLAGTTFEPMGRDGA